MIMTETVNIRVCSIHELDEHEIMQLKELTRGERGLMRSTFERALGCEQLNPNRQAFAVIAVCDGRAVGWALVHATGMRERERRYSRVFIYRLVTWHCYLYVHESFRRRGIGRQLLKAATDAADAAGLPPLRTRPWDMASAAFFLTEGEHNEHVWWESYEDPSRWLRPAA